jgi:hypothetical protein
MSIQVSGLAEANAALAQLSREMPRAAARATNRLVYKVWEGEKAQMVGDLDKPRPFSLNAVRYKRASPSQPVGEVYIVDQFRPGQVATETTHYLGKQIKGGRRVRLKRSERAMQAMGLMPRGHVWVPIAVNLDASGNIPGALIKQMIAEFRQYGTRRVDGRKFYLRGGRNVPAQGVWRRVGRREWKPFLRFVPIRTYQRIFDYYGRADREIDYHFAPFFNHEILYEQQRAGLR